MAIETLFYMSFTVPLREEKRDSIALIKYKLLHTPYNGHGPLSGALPSLSHL
jgi:hypothetical protein